MNINVDAHLAAVERSVCSLERDGQPARSVTLSRTYGTSDEDLWDAVTNAERIPRWFLPISGDLQRGGRYQLEGNAGGLITTCKRPSNFSLTWEFGGDVSWVDVSFSRDGNSRTTLTLTHTSLLSEHWETFGSGAAGVGWELGMMSLAIHVEQPDEPVPDEAAFAVSEGGRAFIAGSSERWGQASVDAGTEPEAAHAAASRTTAFYTGEEIEPG